MVSARLKPVTAVPSTVAPQEPARDAADPGALPPAIIDAVMATEAAARFVAVVAEQPAQFLVVRQDDASSAVPRQWSRQFLQLTKAFYDSGMWLSGEDGAWSAVSRLLITL